MGVCEDVVDCHSGLPVILKVAVGAAVVMAEVFGAAPVEPGEAGRSSSYVCVGYLTRRLISETRSSLAEISLYHCNNALKLD